MTAVGHGSRLDSCVQAVLASPGLRSKASIALVSEVMGPSSWLSGPGDDAAAVGVGGLQVVACGEAIWPSFVQADPYGAGFAAVLANVNDVAAMGARPMGIIDTVVGDEAFARAALTGMRDACELYRVPLLGGHLTTYAGPPSISAFAVGVGGPGGRELLSCINVRAGQELVVVACLEGIMRSDFPFFRSFVERGQHLAGDVRSLADVAEAGLARAAKDISMAGLIGSAAMLLEWSGCGITIDLDAVPVPDGVSLEAWLTCFPCFGFLLCCEPATVSACIDAFTARGLTARSVGTVRSAEDNGVVAVRMGDEVREVLDLGTESVTGLAR